jgi:PAS domain S-box-containing protein
MGKKAEVVLANDITNRKQAEDALKLSEEKYRDLFENANDAICILDSDSKFKDANKKTLEMMGYSKEEFLKMSVLDVIPPEQIPRSQEEFENLRNKGYYEKFVGKIRKKDGCYRYVEVNSSAIIDNGRVVGSRDILRDITHRKQTEEKLQLFRNLIDKSNDAIFVNDPDTGLILDVNEKACNCLGYTREELMKMHVFDFETKLLDHFSWRKHIEEVKKKSFMMLEGQLKRKDGSIFPVETNVNIIVLESKSYMIAMVRDITKRKKAQEELRKSEARLCEAQRLAHIGNWEWNIDTNELMWSDENYRIFGIPEDASPSLDLFYDSIHPDDIDFVKNSIVDALNRKKSYDIDMHIIRPDGQKRIVHANGDVDLDETGKPSRMFGTVQDITDRKLAREELKLKAELLDQATDSIFVHDPDGNFIYMNETAYQSRGYTREELMGMNLHELVIPEFARHVSQRINSVLENGEAVYESANFVKNGTIIPIEVHSRVFDSGNRKLLLAVTRDITERKEAEKLQREKAIAELYGFIVSALPVFASNVPSQVRNNLVRNFAERFDTNIRPRFEDEIRKLACDLNVKESSNESIPEMLDIFMLWIGRMFSNIGIQTTTSFEKTQPGGIRANFEFLNCPWKGEAKVNPIFCFICRTMVLRSFTWTKLKGNAEQRSSIANGSKTCRFEINVNSPA